MLFGNLELNVTHLLACYLHGADNYFNNRLVLYCSTAAN